MTGAEIIGALLRDYDALTAIVPVGNIKGGRLPEGALPPLLLVRVVSLIDRQPLKRQGSCRSTARIAVTVRAGSYAQQGQIIELVRTCCTGRTGNIGGGTRVAILSAGLGPDVNGPGNSFEQTQDFRVSFDAPV
ncbi:hypothetical protein GCM10007897_15110 [Sphingobium jiangsuense]|uniref:DUF3168 domain-containing protein n=1 Tax=Sphingobium jiangsuense TaxID=870476 RepID=A0A7W6BNN6_9SPHN|nr:hypothetical protein [Sphingobium jiangsuense]MBB3925044.1 hypothetical protein [Sphingobium jiangsuense]GLT00127.1 hypothetical protein GCM10007897_15110 [Sphingobium jiangsuense]